VTLADDVRAAIDRGDAERVRDLLAAATEKERRAVAKASGERWLHSTQPPQTIAMLGTATAREIGTWWWSFTPDPRVDALAYDVLAARGRGFFETLTRTLVTDGTLTHWPVVRRGVREGLIDEPADGDAYAYVRGMVAGLGDHAGGDILYDALLADPELLEADLWRIFEVDCSSELVNAIAWTTREDMAHQGENRWLVALTRLAAEGRVDRQRLLDASLTALMRDFRPSMVGWYAQLHEALEPTDDERRARADAYLALLGSPAPAVVKEGLAGLRQLVDHPPSAELAAAAIGPLSQKQKNLAVEMLRLLEFAARDAQARPDVLEAVAIGLGHERGDVQERALALLEKHADDVPRAALLPYGEVVAAQLRPRLAALTGLEEAIDRVELPSAWPEPVQPRMTVERLRGDVAALEAVASVDELIEVAALLLEGQGSGDDAERFLDGVSRLCDERPAGFERRTAGLVKQVEGRVIEFPGRSGAHWVRVVVDAWVRGRRPPSEPDVDSVLDFLGRRAIEVAARARRRNARPLLAFPTHAGGWIDPDVLAERVQAVGRFRNRPDAADRLQASLRAFPPLPELRYEPGVETQEGRAGGREYTIRLFELRPSATPAGLGDLEAAVAGIGRAGATLHWSFPSPWGAWDALGARWSLTVLPSLPQVAFAGAAMLIEETLDLAPVFHPEVVLEHALDANVPLDGAWFAVAAALVTKTPDLQRVATDVVVASVDDGRFDAEGLGPALGWLASQGFVKVSRLAGPFRDAGRVTPLHAAQVVRAAEAFLAHLDGPAARGIQAPLEVVLEHSTLSGYRIGHPGARATLERFRAGVSPSSKLGRITGGLLA